MGEAVTALQSLEVNCQSFSLYLKAQLTRQGGTMSPWLALFPHRFLRLKTPESWFLVCSVKFCEVALKLLMSVVKRTTQINVTLN